MNEEGGRAGAGKSFPPKATKRPSPNNRGVEALVELIEGLPFVRTCGSDGSQKIDFYRVSAFHFFV